MEFSKDILIKYFQYWEDKNWGEYNQLFNYERKIIDVNPDTWNFINGVFIYKTYEIKFNDGGRSYCSREEHDSKIKEFIMKSRKSKWTI